MTVITIDRSDTTHILDHTKSVTAHIFGHSVTSAGKWSGDRNIECVATLSMKTVDSRSIRLNKNLSTAGAICCP